MVMERDLIRQGRGLKASNDPLRSLVALRCGDGLAFLPNLTPVTHTRHVVEHYEFRPPSEPHKKGGTPQGATFEMVEYYIRIT